MSDGTETSVENHLDSMESRADAVLDRLSAERVASWQSEGEEGGAEDVADAPPANDAVANDNPTDPDAPANENGADATEPPAAAKLKGEAQPTDEDLDQRARLERERVAWKREQAQRDRETQERIAKLEARESAIERREKRFEDADEFFTYIEDKGWGEAYAQHLLKMADPTVRAEAAAKRAAKGVKSEVDEELAALRAERAAIAARQEAASTYHAFSSRLGEVAEEAPLAARLLKRAPQRAIERANAIAIAFPPDVAFNLDDIIIRLDAELKEEARLFQDDEPQQPGSQQQPTSQDQQPKPDAAAKANTVSNRAAASRTAIVTDDVPMTLEERVERAQRRMRRMA